MVPIVNRQQMADVKLGLENKQQVDDLPLLSGQPKEREQLHVKVQTPIIHIERLRGRLKKSAEALVESSFSDKSMQKDSLKVFPVLPGSAQTPDFISSGSLVVEVGGEVSEISGVFPALESPSVSRLPEKSVILPQLGSTEVVEDSLSREN